MSPSLENVTFSQLEFAVLDFHKAGARSVEPTDPHSTLACGLPGVSPKGSPTSVRREGGRPCLPAPSPHPEGLGFRRRAAGARDSTARVLGFRFGQKNIRAL